MLQAGRDCARPRPDAGLRLTPEEEEDAQGREVPVRAAQVLRAHRRQVDPKRLARDPLSHLVPRAAQGGVAHGQAGSLGGRQPAGHTDQQL